MPLGNSITQGDENHSTYRYSLWKMLKNDGYDIDYVGSLKTNHRGSNPAQDFDQDHEGHWGWRTDQIISGIPGHDRISDVIQKHSPDIVLLHLGSNDIFQGESIDEAVGDLRRVVQILRSFNPEIVILIAQLLPVADEQVNRRIDLLNLAISRLPDEMNLAAKLIMVNQNNGFDPYKDTYDGIHPDMTGERKMALQWYEALKPVLSTFINP
jgi:lysophospholipase L1-like esterase